MFEQFAGKGAFALGELLEDTKSVGRVLELVVEASKAVGKIVIGLSYLTYLSPIMLAVTLAMVPAGVGVLHLSFGHYRRASKQVGRAGDAAPLGGPLSRLSPRELLER